MGRYPEPQDYKDVSAATRRYLDSESVAGALVVDCANQDDLERVYDDLSGLDIVSAKDLCRNDFPPPIDDLVSRFKRVEKKTLFKRFSPFWLLKGERETTAALSAILNAEANKPVVVVTYKLARYLQKYDDPRITPRILLVRAHEETPSPRLLFAAREFLPKGKRTKGALQELGEAVETAKYEKDRPTELLFETNRRFKDYPDSLFVIDELKTARDALVRVTPELATIAPNALTQDEWRLVWDETRNLGSWQAAIEHAFDGRTAHALVKTLEAKEPFKRPVDLPLFFLALKLYAPRDESYLSRVVAASERASEFFDQLYQQILTVPPSSPQFDALYQDRRAMLGEDESALIANARSRFIAKANEKGIDAVLYMTDQSIEERKAILNFMAKNGFELGRERVLTILERVYPLLYDYLADYQFKDPLLSEYFRDYRFLKVVNRVSAEFLERVNRLALDRSVNASLPACSLKLSSLNHEGARVYFVDALGVEFLSFLVKRAREKKLSVEVDVCRCAVPSTTEINKPFIKEILRDEDEDIQNLDAIKHGGHGKPNKKEPTAYIAEELEELKAIVTRISADLNQGKYDRVYLVTDHGSSRLAVLYEPETKVEMAASAERSGRCCPKSDTDAPPSGAMEEGDWWAFANYERFKGGRKAFVETHGGASLEEICVPVIEFKLLDQKITTELGTVDSEGRFNSAMNPTITKKTKDAVPTLYFSASRTLKSPRVKIKGREVTNVVEKVATPTDAYVYSVALPGIEKGKYEAQIYDGDNLVGGTLTFEIASGGAKKRSIL